MIRSQVVIFQAAVACWLLVSVGCQPAKPELAKPAAAVAPAPPPAPVAQASEPAPAAVPTPERPPLPDKIILGEDVLKFGAGSVLSPKGQEAVRKLGGQLQPDQGGYRLVITGYTATGGNRTSAMILSHKRAEAVAKALVRAGIPADRITVRGLGPEAPIADNKTPAGRLKNRRIELEFKAI